MLTAYLWLNFFARPFFRKMIQKFSEFFAANGNWKTFNLCNHLYSDCIYMP